MKWFLNITGSPSRLTEWGLWLAELDFEVRYKKRNENHHADALSRLLTGSLADDDAEDELPSSFLEETEAHPHLKIIDINETFGFIEHDFDKVDQNISMKEAKEHSMEQNDMEELITSEHNDAFCAKLSRRLNVGENLSFLTMKMESPDVSCTSYSIIFIAVTQNLLLIMN